MLSNPLTDKIKVSEDQIEDLFIEGIISENLYYQCLITLAHTQVCEEFNLEQALIIINRIPAEYFGRPIIDQIKADKGFAAIAAELVHRIVRNGVLPDADIDVNVPVAEA